MPGPSHRDPSVQQRTRVKIEREKLVNKIKIWAMLPTDTMIKFISLIFFRVLSHYSTQHHKWKDAVDRLRCDGGKKSTKLTVTMCCTSEMARHGKRNRKRVHCQDHFVVGIDHYKLWPRPRPWIKIFNSWYYFPTNDLVQVAVYQTSNCRQMLYSNPAVVNECSWVRQPLDSWTDQITGRKKVHSVNIVWKNEMFRWLVSKRMGNSVQSTI